MWRSHGKIAFGILSICILSGCLPQAGTQIVPPVSGKEGESEAKHASDKSDSKANNGKPHVTNVKWSSGELEIQGKNLPSIKSIAIRDNSQHHRLSFRITPSGIIKAVAAGNLSLSMGKVYQLIVSTAYAEESVPISVEIPANYFDPSAIKGTGAGVGMVLKWNGTKWAPAPDYIGVGSQSQNLIFMGFTQPYDAALGGHKGGNEKCEAEYPGSHWASEEEIMKLGSSYPWTYSVWVRSIAGREPVFSSAVESLGVRVDSCYGWTRITHPTTHAVLSNAGSHTSGTILEASGAARTVGCASLIRLACVR
jgi:hypothetical protein